MERKLHYKGTNFQHKYNGFTCELKWFSIHHTIVFCSSDQKFPPPDRIFCFFLFSFYPTNIKPYLYHSSDIKPLFPFYLSSHITPKPLLTHPFILLAFSNPHLTPKISLFSLKFLLS
ncbi:unnamed protein product [Moneuplotes crassus]|uniref:Uncharacterized protein n=1 Tax=Euplotes crassus TaxID=5936 RepID=A0AAD1XXB9_EUPCR|nr:unnamed protein product [Moneuplotes crassus]